MSKEKMDEAAVLLDEVQVGPYRFRAWSLEQLGELLPVIMQLLDRFLVSGLDVKSEEDFKAEALQQLLPLAVPLFPAIIAVTLRLSAEEVAKIPKGLQLALGLRILLHPLNLDEIKNFSAGFLGGENPASSSH